MSRCPKAGCGSARVRKKGYFVTKWNAQTVPRYKCHDCGKHFSSHTFRRSYRQHKPFLNSLIFQLYSSCTTQRRLAKVLGVNRKTVVRKFLYLAGLANEMHAKRLAGQMPVAHLQFDETESFEHTRLKPLSIGLAVDNDTREILAAKVCSMPFKGKLAAVALKKYGYRTDDRPKMRSAVFATLAKACPAVKTITTDSHLAYPRLAKTYFPKAAFLPVKSRTTKLFRHNRRNENDRLFNLNFVCSKIRHDLSRMSRRVWVTTKKPERLELHLALYLAYHNNYLLPS